MKKLFLLTAAVFFTISLVFAQKSKSVFLELGGNGGGFSLNFDSRLTKSDKGIGFRAGVGIIPGINSAEADILFPSTPTMLTVPVGINHLAGKAPHYFESGLGVTYVYVNGNIRSNFWGYDEKIKGGSFLFIPSIGYRHAKVDKAFQFRVVVSPVIGSGGASFWAGVSFGYKF